jgi:DNA-binding transcriptional MerR regulator
LNEPTYTISELAREFDITTRTIRFYEEKGLINPRREGQKRIYSAADRVRIKLILRGKRIGMTLSESAEVIDLYDPGNNNTHQLKALISSVNERREKLRQQQRDIDEMLSRLDEVKSLCESALASAEPAPLDDTQERTPS